MSVLVYFYPQRQKGSFNYVATNHINELKKRRFQVITADENIIDDIRWVTKNNVVLHPFLYFLVGHNYVTYSQKKHRIDIIRKVSDKLIGFDVTDTDKLSDVAVDALNIADLIFVPSHFCRETMINSGVDTNIRVLPHGINEVFYRNVNVENCETYRKLNEIKTKKNAFLVLFFLTHSGFRKGADVVYKAMKAIQSEFSNVLLVVKREKLADPYINLLRTLKMIEIADWIPDEELRALYEVCDMTIVPSRGGGFELNALESIASGTPTAVTNYGCFLDYIDYTIPIACRGKIRLFRDNIVHVGYGVDPCYESLSWHIREVYHEREYYNELFEGFSKEVLNTYTWQRTGEILSKTLRKFGIN